jgi:hypothetical protein
LFEDSVLTIALDYGETGSFSTSFFISQQVG